jgi:hypothetical protein
MRKQERYTLEQLRDIGEEWSRQAEIIEHFLQELEDAGFPQDDPIYQWVADRANSMIVDAQGIEEAVEDTAE